MTETTIAICLKMTCRFNTGGECQFKSVIISETGECEMYEIMEKKE